MGRKQIGSKNKNYIDMDSITFVFSILMIIFMVFFFSISLQWFILIGSIFFFCTVTIPTGINTLKHIKYKKAIEYDENGLYIYGVKIHFIPYNEIVNVSPKYEVGKYHKKSYGKIVVKTKSDKIFKSCVINDLNDITNELLKIIDNYKKI